MRNKAAGTSSPLTALRSGMKVVLLFLGFSLLSAEAPAPWDIEDLVGKRAPDFTLPDMSGRNVSLASFKGRVVIINFWATWCPPCRSEMPSLNRLYKEYKSKGLVVLAVSTDRTSGAVKDYLTGNPFDFPILLDPENSISRRFRVFSIPTSFLIDKNSIIAQRYIGEENWDSPEIRSKTKEVLGIQ